MTFDVIPEPRVYVRLRHAITATIYAQSVHGLTKNPKGATIIGAQLNH
jgi:hypothetical protein